MRYREGGSNNRHSSRPLQLSRRSSRGFCASRGLPTHSKHPGSTSLRSRHRPMGCLPSQPNVPAYFPQIELART